MVKAEGDYHVVHALRQSLLESFKVPLSQSDKAMWHVHACMWEWQKKRILSRPGPSFLGAAFEVVCNMRLSSRLNVNNLVQLLFLKLLDMGRVMMKVR